MARKRMIDPSFWIDEKLGSVEPRARLLFMGLISQADDDGRLNGHPALLKSIIFPYDHEIEVKSVDEWINGLSTQKLIVRYEIGSQKYIYIPNFSKHQTINRPSKSKLPPPPSEDSNTIHGTLNEDSVSVHSQRKGKEGKLNEREENIREGNISDPPSDDSIKDSLLKLINKNNITAVTIFGLDQIYAYIGTVDIEVIETAINKSTGKAINYAVRTLQGMISDGVKKKEQLTTSGKVTNFRGSNKPVIPTVVNESINTNAATEEEMNELRELARRLDASNG